MKDPAGIFLRHPIRTSEEGHQLRVRGGSLDLRAQRLKFRSWDGSMPLLGIGFGLLKRYMLQPFETWPFPPK